MFGMAFEICSPAVLVCHPHPALSAVLSHPPLLELLKASSLLLLSLPITPLTFFLKQHRLSLRPVDIFCDLSLYSVAKKCHNSVVRILSGKSL